MKQWSLLFLIVSALLIASCGPSTKVPDPQPLPAGQTWAGVWYSQQFEHMYLRQTGDDVRGIYTYKDGGTLEGKMNGNLLTFTWIDPGSKTEARRTIQGQGYLTMQREGDDVTLRGEWGYNDDRGGAGVWTAEFVRAMDAEDPRTLEEWREQR